MSSCPACRPTRPAQVLSCSPFCVPLAIWSCPAGSPACCPARRPVLLGHLTYTWEHVACEENEFAYLCMPHYIMCEPRQVNSTWEVSRTRSGRTLARTTHRVLLNAQLVTLIRGSQAFARFESSLRVYSPTRLLGPCRQ